jgi:molybdopterin/thiamine biosynthesis adenylyltransferase
MSEAPEMGVHSDAYTAVILDPDDPDDREVLEGLHADERISMLDRHAQARRGLAELRPKPDEAVMDEPMRWAYYPWRRSAVAILGPRGYRALRLDRNRNMITSAEQDRLGTLKLGVAGLSVGHVIAHTMAVQGLCGELRLADFDVLELSNLNRVPATVFDLGVNKAKVAARRVAEVDPYLPVHVLDDGLTFDNADSFVAGLDIVVEECDALDMKAVLREMARARGIPVLMSTSDRGLVDVERFDLEPTRPILHGLLGEVDAALFPGMSSREKIPHILRHLDAERLSPRTAASLVEVDRSLSTWPQLASDVNLGATALAEAVRRIGLGEPLNSGRARVDVGWALDQLREPEMASAPSIVPPPPQSGPAPVGVVDIVAAAANRAPSGGNVQPWWIETSENGVTIGLAAERTSALDVGFRGSAVAVGAAVFNARVAAAAHARLGPVTVTEDDDRDVPLRATVGFADGDDPTLGALYEPMLLRVTNRAIGKPLELPESTIVALQDAADREGARLRVLTDRTQLEVAARLLGAADRIRYLTARLHAEMIDELRWPGDPEPDTGIEVASLGLDPSDEAVLGILRRADVMAHLAEWDAGTALGDFTRDRVSASSGLGVVTMTGSRLTDFARGGSSAEAVWISAEQHGLAVQPMSPVFLYARTPDELTALSPGFSGELTRLRSDFRDLARVDAADELVLVMRFTAADRPAMPSRRNPDRIKLPPGPDHLT